jgi:gluconate kinase
VRAAFPLVILIVGIPGSGKTTVARALSERFDAAACIEGDLVQSHFTVSGLVGPGDAPKEESDRQLRLRWRNCACLAANFWAAGFTAVVEHAVGRRSWIDLFLAEVGDAPVSLIVLAPTLDVALQRDQRRPDKQVAERFTHMDAELRAELAGFGWWLDTSDLTVGETVERILTTGVAAGLVTEPTSRS